VTAGLLNFTARGRLPVVHQTEAAECGLACLAMIASYHGHRIDLNTLRRRHPVSLKGVTLRALIEVAEHLNFICRPIRFDLGHLGQLHLPAIVHWDMNHFVVLKSVTRSGVVVHDPTFGRRFVQITEASKHLTASRLSSHRRKAFCSRTREHGSRFRSSGNRCAATHTHSSRFSFYRWSWKFL
jgi:ATP-binding cassette, subfamily B, bacterial CvaB/MchF/RaxB